MNGMHAMTLETYGSITNESGVHSGIARWIRVNLRDVGVHGERARGVHQRREVGLTR